jgi:hypothetical protein
MLEAPTEKIPPFYLWRGIIPVKARQIKYLNSKTGVD